jgi:PAS domain S-box-containing protein
MKTNSDSNYLKKELYECIKTDESIFDFIQESSIDGMWYWDLENPENEWMNPRFWTTLGYNPEEMPHLSSAWQSIINPEDLKTALQNLERHLKDPKYKYDQIVRYTHKNGSTVWIRCRGMAIRDKQGKPIRMIGSHHDITALKNTEFALEKNAESAEISESMFQRAFEYSGIGMVLADTNKKLMKANVVFCEMLGYSENELIGKTISEITFVDDAPLGMEEMDKCIENTLDHFKLQKRYIHKSGKII